MDSIYIYLSMSHDLVLIQSEPPVAALKYC